MNPDEVKDLLPLVKYKADRLISLAKEKGFTLRITSGYRSKEEQDRLYAQGRTVAGKIVTNAKGGQSLHNYGVAFDVVDRNRGYNLFPKEWAILGQIGADLGLQWGGRWSGFPDYPHFELTLDYGLNDFMQGKVDYSKYIV